MRNSVQIDPENPRDQDIDRAAKLLKCGGLIIYPTDTVYGLGVDAENPQALDRLFSIKQRDRYKPVSLIASDVGMVKKLTAELPEYGEKLMDSFWPGPLTIVLKTLPGNPGSTGGDRGTIGIRIPANELCIRLVRAFGRPITSTSANLSGGADCSAVDQIHRSLRSAADLIIDAGRTEGAVPSTVISIAEDRPRIIREGAVPKGALETIAGSMCATEADPV